jgi:hypothetical protein
MADEKISAMPLAGALTGTEVLPMVQDGENVKVAVATIVNFSAQAVYVRNFAGIAPAVTPTGEAIALDTSSGFGWGYDGSAWTRFF